jgi:Plasmid pRiA4b ORF-3-like protein
MSDGGEVVIYQLRVILKDISPLIWRRLLVPGDYSIADLHYILQIAFDWDNVHLHRFEIYGKEYGIWYDGGISFSDNPHKVQLADFNFRKGEKFFYEYDFGDSWQHLIRVEDILSFDLKKKYPLCTGGRNLAPIEDYYEDEENESFFEIQNESSILLGKKTKRIW